MSEFSAYMKAKSDAEAAYNLYNYAGQKLELARVRERLAEIRSQTDPLDTLIRLPMSERERLYAAAHYVVTGHHSEAARDAMNAARRKP